MAVGYTLTTLARQAERWLLRWRPPAMSV